MNKICTTIEQSKKLIDLRINVNTADMYWWNCHGWKLSANPYTEEVKNGYKKHELECIPAWSLSALLELIPDELQDNHFLTLEKEKDEYCCCFEDINGNSFNHFFGNNAIDATLEMIYWLIENNKI